MNFLILAKRKKCPHLELFWSVFSRTRNEYSVLCISPYLVRMRENTDQNNSEYGHYSRSESERHLIDILYFDFDLDTRFFTRKQFFCLVLNVFNTVLEIRLRFP